MITQALNDISIYIGALFMQHMNPALVYHNLEHTEDVVQHATEIARHYQLSGDETFIVTAAAWFHDTGHLFVMENHEQKSAAIMRAYFAETDITDGTVRLIESCILATRMPTHPQSLLESILCDADIYHLGTDTFWVSDKKVRKEMELRTGKQFPDWPEMSLAFLCSQHFYTDYCRQLLDKGRENNAAILKNMLN